MNCSLQSSLSCILETSSFFNFKTTHFKNRLYFHQNHFIYSKRSMLCTCSSNSIKSSFQTGDKAKPFVITTPLYYVNAPPHMGTYTNIAVDAIARFKRHLGKRVIFITRTDEHGEKIAMAESACGSSPSKHCDAISQAYQMLWKDLDIAYDKFIHTTDPKHEATVKEFYSRVLTDDDIYWADYEGLYCVTF